MNLEIKREFNLSYCQLLTEVCFSLSLPLGQLQHQKYAAYDFHFLTILWNVIIDGFCNDDWIHWTV
jgi:hypothetical protein